MPILDIRLNVLYFQFLNLMRVCLFLIFRSDVYDIRSNSMILGRIRRNVTKTFQIYTSNFIRFRPHLWFLKISRDDGVSGPKHVLSLFA
jgi:hypothetical protein